jgi:hypothetical protein
LAASQVTIAADPPSNAVAGSMWWDSDNGMLYVRYNDGDSSQWVQATAMPVVDTTAFVQKTGDTMSGHLSLPITPAAANAVRKDYVDAANTALDTALRAYAAPFDAMAYSGMQINGSMEVSQEKGASPTTNSTYVVDGWRLMVSGTAAISVAQYPSGVYFPSLPYCLAMLVNTAQASIGAADYYMIWQHIEGWRIARLNWGKANAQPITIGFWTAHHRTGVYTGSVRNSATNRSYAFTYTQTVADVGQFNTITIPGDTTGTWAIDNTTGIILTFAIAMGSSSIASVANAWTTTGAAAPGQINGVAATSDVFRITGVVVLPGTQAPTAAQSPLLMRPYDQELLTCQRYYQKYSGTTGNALMFLGSAQGAHNISWVIPHIPKRANPTATKNGTWFVNANTSQPIMAGADLYTHTVYVTAVGIGPVQANPLSAADTITIDARL